MTSFTARIISVATITLAALPLAAVASQAQAAPAVRIADLDVNTAEGRAAYDQRVEAAADRFCRETKGLSAIYACKVGVRTEVQEKLIVLQQRTARLARR